MNEDIEILTRQKHAELRLRPHTTFRFAATAHLAPLVLSEMPEAAKTYPLVFVRYPEGGILPAAILGLESDQNLFVDAGGGWDAPYIPAHFRRYPFILVDQGDAYVMGADIRADHWALSGEEGERVFSEDGSLSPKSVIALDLLRSIQAEIAPTRQLGEELDRSGLLVERAASIATGDGEPDFEIGGLWIIHEERIKSLDPQTALRWLALGWMLPIHAHLVSLSNFAALGVRGRDRARRLSGEPG